MNKLISACAFIALGIAHTANAYVINGSSFTDNQHAQSFNGNASFSAYGAGATDANFLKKSQAGYTGVGVAGGRTNGEIDTNESIVGAFSSAMTVNSLMLGLLFDGPEYGDVNEVAAVSIFDGNSWLMGTLTAINSDTAMWSFGGNTASITATSPAINGLGGVWVIDNPFAGASVNNILFTALPGQCGTAGGTCTNQSDYTLNKLSYSSVPEPSTIALLAAGLIGLGIARRNSRNFS